jgi:putative transcription factor
MCGTEDSLVVALVEGVELKVCKKCISYGKVLKKPVFTGSASRFKKVEQKSEKETVILIKDDFAKLIKDKREKMGLRQQEFAKFLAEKESLVHQMESGTYVPPIELARKLERQLNIILIEEKEIAPQHMRAKTDEVTIGDMIKLK